MSHARVHFQLEQDEDGYPPVGVETLWVEASPNAAEYVIDSIPFFVRDATVGDTIVVREEEGPRWFDAVVTERGFRANPSHRERRGGLDVRLL